MRRARLISVLTASQYEELVYLSFFGITVVGNGILRVVRRPEKQYITSGIGQMLFIMALARVFATAAPGSFVHKSWKW